MRLLWAFTIVSLTLPLGCQSERRRSAGSGSKAKQQPAPEVDHFARLIRELPSSNNGCPDAFDYFPDGGMRNMWCHARTILSFAALAETWGKGDVFVSGPHKKNDLVLDAERSFGHYNPEFVAWLVARAVPAETDAGLRRATQGGYDKTLRTLARVYLRTRLRLGKSPTYLKQELAYLEAYGSGLGEVTPHYRHSELEPPEAYNVYAPAMAFWVRREADGTAALFEKGLRKLMQTYDPNGIRTEEARDYAIIAATPGSVPTAPKNPPPPPDKVVEAPPVEPPPADPVPIPDPPPKTLEKAPELASTKSAPADLALRIVAGLDGTKNGCADVFDYFPGGLRTTFCHAKELVTLQQLSDAIPMSIFVGGPHRPATLVLDSETDFGRYNPKFARWLHKSLIPQMSPQLAKPAVRAVYAKTLRPAARAFYLARRTLEGDKRLSSRLKKGFRTYLAKPSGTHPRYGYWELIKAPIDTQVIGGSAVGFWVRRSIDGTDQHFAKALRAALKAADPEFFAEAEGLSVKALSARESLFEVPRN